MPSEAFLLQVVFVGVGLVAFLIFVAYLMAAQGAYNDTRFGRAVF